ncbi:hypothetical protein MycrhDRAFT_0847 [Mycolicibacterium rhodesiae JS60]|nr:hypothetical protein MycrhDRAFT_0847 [Mycolicibacterium rhodesiae JS60]
MDHAARRPMLAAAALTTAGALALAPISIAPSDLHAASTSPLRVSTQAVQLTDAWTDLFADTGASVVQLAAMFLGADGNYPLPTPTIPLAPIATQLVLNQFIYAAQLLSGQGGQIPGEIATHLTAVGNVAGQVVASLPPVISQQLATQFGALAITYDSIVASSNLLIGLLEAPAVFLNLALNSTFGLLGEVGPIGFALTVRNALAEAIYTAPPTIVLPFKKAASTPKSVAATTVKPKVASPSGTAGSARAKPKASSSASSDRKATSAKAGTKSGGAGQGHSKRG